MLANKWCLDHCWEDSYARCGWVHICMTLLTLCCYTAVQ